MFAILETGGKQFRVQEGTQVRVPKIDAQIGSSVEMDKVLLVGGTDFKVGGPYVQGASVACEIMEHGRDKKIIVFKKKRRKDYRKKQGHRQDFTTIQVKSITA